MTSNFHSSVNSGGTVCAEETAESTARRQSATKVRQRPGWRLSAVCCLFIAIPDVAWRSAHGVSRDRLREHNDARDELLHFPGRRGDCPGGTVSSPGNQAPVGGRVAVWGARSPRCGGQGAKPPPPHQPLRH